MNTATIILLFLLGVDLTVHIAKDGQPHDDYNALGAFISTVILLVLFHYAGLF